MTRRSGGEAAGLGVILWACGSVALMVFTMLGLTACEPGSDTDPGIQHEAVVDAADTNGINQSWVWESWGE